MESSIKTIHASVLVQGALLQAIAFSAAKKTELIFEFSQCYIPIIQGLNKDKDRNEEFVNAVESEYQRISAQLPKVKIASA